MILIVSLGTLQSQNFNFSDPFKGFHIGLTGQIELIKGSSYNNIHGTVPPPSREMPVGGQGRIEFSYNFAKYFGISTGFGVGTACDIDDWMIDPYTNQESQYSIFFGVQEYEFFIPLKFEFHYPVHKNIYLMAELSGIMNGFVNKVCKENNGCLNDMLWGKEDMYFDLHRSSYFPLFDIAAAIGIYYRLPYGDLLRLSVGYNYVLKPTWEGSYAYPLHNSGGDISLRHNYMFAQLGYFHTFNFEKAKRMVKKQNLNFSSKKEQRNYIIKMLNGRQ